MNNLSKALFLPALLAFMFYQTGCINLKPPADGIHYYILSPLEEAEDTSTNDGEVILGLLPIALPEYLDTGHIALRNNQHELTFSENNRWAGSLGSSIAQSLRQNLIDTGSVRTVIPAPWPENNAISYILQVGIDHFEGTADGMAILAAHWALKKADEKIIAEDKAWIVRRWNGQDYTDLVRALNEGCRALAERIAADLLEEEVPPQK